MADKEFKTTEEQLPTDIFNEMKSDIVALTKKYPFVRMKYYGFRDNWQQML